VIPIANRASLPKTRVGRLACAALALCVPATSSAETLADAIASAYDRNPQMVQERYLQKARDEGVVQARSNYGPNINVQSQLQHTHISPLQFLQSEGTTQQTAVTINQPLYTSGRVRGQVAAATAAMKGGREQLRLTEEQLVQNVIQVYAGVLRDEERLDCASRPRDGGPEHRTRVSARAPSRAAAGRGVADGEALVRRAGRPGRGRGQAAH